MPKRVVSLNVLPGEPTDGSGRICIHLFVQDDKGKFVEPHVLYPKGVGKELGARPTRGRLACDPNRRMLPVAVGNVIRVTPRTDDPRAVTCPKCIASEYYNAAMTALGG